MLPLALVVLTTPDAGALRPSPPNEQPTKAAMRGVLEALVELEPLVNAPERLRDPAKADEISRRLQTLAQLDHAFPKDSKAQEPATAALSGLFSQYARETRRRFSYGERETIGARVRTLMSLCFTCHSRERAAYNFHDVERKLDASTLSAVDKAQFLAVTRQFDRAVEAYRAIVDAPTPNERARLNQTRAVKDLLTLLVRVKDDVKGTEQLLDGLSARADLSVLMKKSVNSWKKEVALWKKEAFDANKASSKELFLKAKTLIQRTNGTRTYVPDDFSEVSFLRASGYLNLALNKEPKSADRGEALFLLGICAGALKSPLAWEVDLLFFETCIRENPKTPLALQCFGQLSDRLYFGYTGSAGTHLPDEEVERLATLRALAE